MNHALNEELGIDEAQARRWMQVAEVPRDVFDIHPIKVALNPSWL